MPVVRSKDGCRIFYQVDSLAPPWRSARDIVLMHHGVALNGDAWVGWLPNLLAAGLSVVRLDMRGFGRSDQVPPDYAWSMDGFFADIDAVTADLGLDDFHYVGESLGGLIGLALAARRPARVKSLGLLSTPFDGARIGPALDEWPGFIERDGMAGWSAALMSMRFAPGGVDEALYDWVLRLQAECAAHAVLGQAAFIRTQNLEGELSAIAAPVLIMAPDGSPFVKASLAADLHARLPTSELRWYPGERHSLLMSRAGDCSAAYAEFIGRRVARQGSGGASGDQSRAAAAQ